MVKHSITTKVENPGLFHLPMLYKFSLVLIIGIILFYIGRKEIGNQSINQVLLFFYILIKTVFFFKLLFNRIKETAHHSLDYKDILSFIGFNTLLMVVSYAVDYLCLYEINKNSFSGITTGGHLLPHFITFLYFSIATFSTAGFGDIAPLTITARLLASAELMLAWFLTILVIANFGVIRETLNQNSNKTMENEK